MKDITKWFPRIVEPVRVGHYECIVRICPGHAAKWLCEWDGVGFRGLGFMILKWRGMTKAAYLEAVNKTSELTGAAMRCYVASKLGDKVEIPEEFDK